MCLHFYNSQYYYHYEAKNLFFFPNYDKLCCNCNCVINIISQNVHFYKGIYYAKGAFILSKIQ